jgi:hypothetical protein
MKAITVEPKVPGTARLTDVPEPDAASGSVLVQAIAVGSAALTSRSWRKVWPGPARKTRRSWATNPWVVDPGPSWRPEGRAGRRSSAVRTWFPAPAARWGMGHVGTGGATEHGIKEIDGFMSELADRPGVHRKSTRLGSWGVVEPTTVVVKAWSRRPGSASASGSHGPRW